MKRWWLVIALLLSLGVNAGILATLAVRRLSGDAPGPAPQTAVEDLPGEADRNPEGPEGPPPRVMRLADRLGLEGEPRRKFIDVQMRFFAETVRLRTQQAEVYRELRRALASRQPDRERIESLLQESARLHLGLEQATARHVLASRELLDRRQERLFLQILARLRAPGAGLGAPGGQPPRDPRRRPRWQEPWDRPPLRGQPGQPGDAEGPPPDRLEDPGFEE